MNWAAGDSARRRCCDSSGVLFQAKPIQFVGNGTEVSLSELAFPRELQDNAVPSGSAMAALVLSRLAGLAVEPRYLDLARAALGPGASYRAGDAS